MNPSSVTQQEDTVGSTVILGEEPGDGDRLAQGTRVHRFVVVRHVADGGMGELYKAYDPELDRAVALKLLRSSSGGETATANDAGKERLLREAKALAKLSHPNVVAIFDVGTYDDRVFVAMEYVEGATLRELLRGGLLGRDEWLTLYLAAGAGLAAAHGAGLVHRDFKPDNVMRGADGRVRVLDFGLARTVRRDDPSPEHAGAVATADAASSGPRLRSVDVGDSVTVVGSIVGTPRYMAPEQFEGADVDARSDQFSFCVALYEALYGASPFGTGTMDELRARVLAGRVDDAPRGARVPRALRRLLLRGLSPRPLDRHASMDALLAAIQHVRRAPMRAVIAGAAACTVALAAFGAYATVARRAPPLPTCGGSSSSLESAWGEARKHDLQSAFAGLGLSYGDAAYRGAARSLDAYATRWTAMRVETCEATELRHEQSPELLDRRMACLNDRMTEMRAVTDVLASPTPKVVERAVQAAESLAPVEDCAAAAVLASARPARAPRRGPAADAVRKQIADARALEAGGRFTDGASRARAAVEAALARGDFALVADARLALARSLTGLADFKETEKMLRAAWLDAERADDATLIARARTMMVRAVGEEDARYPEADEWAQLAEASVDRLDRGDLIRAELELHRSNLEMREGKLAPALERAHLAVDLAVKTYGADTLAHAGALKLQNAVEFAMGKREDARRSLDAAIAVVDRTVGREHPFYGKLLIALADLEGTGGDHVGAIDTYLRALAIAERTVGSDHPMIGHVTNNLGEEELALGRFADARAHYTRAHAVWAKVYGADHPFVAVTLHNLGEERLASGSPREAETLLEQALTMRTRAEEADPADVAEDRVALGDAYLAAGKEGQARETYAAARAVLERPDHARPEVLGRALTGLSRIDLDGRAPSPALSLATRAVELVGEDDGARGADARMAFARATLATGGATGTARAAAEKARDAYARSGRERDRQAADAWLAALR
jgi:serine/threonine protein kinase